MIARLRNKSLGRDTRGAAAIEFAMCAPVLLLAILGLFDMGHNMYTASIIHGAVQKVARNSTIEGAVDQETALDQRVHDMVSQIAPDATFQFSRTAYSTFFDVGQPEDWNDVNADGSCNDGEPFEDANGNGSWDEDMGRTGFGGARDAVLYEVRVTYLRPFPVSSLMGQPKTFTTVTRTVLRNQPFAAQNVSRAAGSCA